MSRPEASQPLTRLAAHHHCFQRAMLAHLITELRRTGWHVLGRVQSCNPILRLVEPTGWGITVQE